MTIIVYKDGFMAADRSYSADGKHLYEACKIVRGKRTIGAAAGTITAAKAFREWVEHDMEIPLKADTNTDILGIAFNKDGVYLVADGVFVSVPSGQAHCVGSGSEIALGALDMGADAATAALVASRRMGCVAYGVDVVSLDTPITRIRALEVKVNEHSS